MYKIFLCQFLFIVTLVRMTSASWDQDPKPIHKFIVQAPHGIPWDPLLCAVQQANLKQVEQLLRDDEENDDEFYNWGKAVDMAQDGAENIHYHPTTRQKYYKIYEALIKDTPIHNCISIRTVEEMEEEYRQAHQKVVYLYKPTSNLHKIKRLHLRFKPPFF